MTRNEHSSAQAGKAILASAILIVSGTTVAYGQTISTKDFTLPITSNVNVLNTPTVKIDPTKNTVRLPNTASDPLPVTVIGGGVVRRPFQAGVNLSIQQGGNAAIATIPIPAGKRLVIEDVSAVTSQSLGQSGLLLEFTTALGDAVGVAGNSPFEDHELVLVSQGEFNGIERRVVQQKVLIFADETVETTTGAVHGLGINVHLSRGTFAGFASVRITFSGYLEDPPAAALGQ